MSIKEYKKYKGVCIFQDYNVVDGEQVYIGNGQGCRTFWFASVKEAHKFIDHFNDKMDVTDLGCVNLIPKKICKKCKGHYSFGTIKWEEAKTRYACKDYKQELKRQVREKGENNGKNKN